MTREDKELLLKDICTRLPFKVKAIDREEIITIRAYIPESVIDDVGIPHSIENIKSYLFPLSSMTEEQQQELESLMEVITIPIWGEILSPTPEYYDWLNKNHFDYRDLIPKDLAIDATGLGIY